MPKIAIDDISESKAYLPKVQGTKNDELEFIYKIIHHRTL